MMTLVSSFLEFVQRLASVMTTPTFNTLVTALTGWVFARRRTVTGMILAANAGVAPMSTIDELDLELFESIRTVNIDAVYMTCRAVWPTMKKQKRGVIVNISSLASVDPFPGFTAYGASKAWVNTWTKALAEEGRPLGIRVFAVAPGAVETGMLRGAFPDFPAAQALDPKDVASLVHATTQPACHYATGQTIFTRRAGD